MQANVNFYGRHGVNLADANLFIFSGGRPLSGRCFYSVPAAHSGCGISVLAWLLHAASLWLAVFADDALRIGFATMLSAALWVTVSVYLIENRNFSLDGLKFLLFAAAGFSILPVFFPGAVIALTGKTAMFPWHVSIALLAYSTLTIAAFHAAIMSLQDKHLHKLRSRTLPPWLSAVIDKLPALLTMEKVLFRLISVGFVY
jgi:ABC-type uncharacterized transport system permease subunit